MKKLIIAFLVIIPVLFSCNSESDSGITLSGTYNAEIIDWKEIGETVFLFRVDKGSFVKTSVIEFDENNEFSIHLDNSQAGLYGIGQRDVYYRFYLSPGDKLIVDIADTVVKIRETNNPEIHKHFLGWDNLMLSFGVLDRNLDATYKDFFPFLEKTLPEADEYLKKTTSNPGYNNFMKAQTDIDITYWMSRFICMPRSIYPTKAEGYPEIYKTRYYKKDKFNYPASEIYKCGYAMWTIPVYIKNLYRLDILHFKFDSDGKPLYNEMDPVKEIECIANDTIKGDIAVNKLTYKGYNLTGLAYSDMYEKVGKYLITEEQKQKVKAYEKTINIYASGTPSPDYKFQDINGKIHHLSDLKGKYVYIDIWATWCNPCIGEIPALKKLEKKFKDKNIEFVSISLDNKKETWQKYIEKNDMNGIQLFAGKGETKFSKYYKYSSIPRFILIDKETKVVMYNAYRPSDERMAKKLESLLAN